METLIDTGSSRFWIIRDFDTDRLDEVIDLPLEIEPPITVMGRECRQRRDISLFSAINPTTGSMYSQGYRYSTTFIRSQPMTDRSLLKQILDRVNARLSSEFNSVLVNRYLDGTKTIGAHSDDERYLDRSRKLVVGLSFGATRTFRIRDKQTRKIVLDVEQEPGMLVGMEGEFQSEFVHEIPRRSRVSEPRVSLTFRRHTE